MLRQFELFDPVITEEKNYRGAKKEYQDIENEMANSLNENEIVDEEITELNKKVHKLVVKLGDVVTRNKMKEMTILTLKSKQDVVSKNVQGL